MKRTIIKGVLILSLALLLDGCFGRFSIKIVSGKQFLDQCPRNARPGDTVTLTTAIVSDADLYVNGNVEITKRSEGIFEFVMPDHNVELTITVIANGLS